MKKNSLIFSLCLVHLFLVSGFLHGQTTVSGLVTEEISGNPLAGANVFLEGTSTGIETGADGFYSLVIPADISGQVVIIASYTGYQSVRKTISANGADQVVNFILLQGTLFLNDITVTAQKREQMAIKTPMSLQALTGEALESVSARDLSDVISFIPGASESLSPNATTRQYQLRGIPQIQSDATIGYYLDDAAYNYYGSLYAPVSRSYDIERIEVLRGPQSTLYGAGAVGGVMKFVPRKPNLQKFGGEIVSGISTTEDGDPGYYFDGMLNLPIVKDKLAARVSGSWEHLGGYMESQDMLKENINDGRIYQVRASLVYLPTDRLDIKFLFQKNNTLQNAGRLMSSLDPPVSSAEPGDEVANGDNWYSFSLNYDFRFATLNTTTSYIHHTDALDLTIPFVGVPGDRVTFTTANEADAFNHETRLVSNNEKDFKWLAGVFYTNSENTQNLVTNPQLFTTDAVFTSSSISFFGEASYAFLDGRLIPLVGLRTFSDTRKVKDSNFVDPGGQPIGELPDKTFSSVNPRFNLSYLPNDHSNFYLNIAKGFRSGQFNNPGVVALHQFGGLPAQTTVDSDQLWSYEVGMKQQQLDGQLIFEVAAYYQDWKDQQFSVLYQGLFLTYSLGNTQIYGLDLGMAYAPRSAKGLTFQFIANFNNAEFKSIDPALSEGSGFENGDKLPLVPDYNIGIITDYAWVQGSSGWKGKALVSFTQMGRQIGTDGNEGDAQSLLRARIGFENSRVGLFLFGNNLLGENGALYVQSSEIGLTTYTQAFPRQIGLEIRATF